MNKSNTFSAEVRGRAVFMVQEHRGEYPSQWAAIESIALKVGCTSQTLLGWVRREDSYDNALAETINGLYKAELVHRHTSWKNRESVELATLEWVAWFSHHRLMEPLGYIPPAETETNYYRQFNNTIAVSAST